MARRMFIPQVTFEVVRSPLLVKKKPLLVKSRAMQAMKIRKTTDVVALARDLLPDDGREHFGVLLCDTMNHVLGYFVVGIGGVGNVLASIREIIGAALRTPGCSSFICVHNHPSGEVKPSEHDKHLTKDVASAAKLFELRFHDHVIIGSGTETFYSFDEKGEIKR
jgi:DNA repair protein RadC